MEYLAGESDDGWLRDDFDRRLTLEFHGSRLISDGGILIHRELDGAIGLTDLAGAVLLKCRRGKNPCHRLIDLFRQSVFGRLAGDSIVAKRPVRWLFRLSGDRIGRSVGGILDNTSFNASCSCHFWIVPGG
jgi:hypothetical protein